MRLFRRKDEKIDTTTELLIQQELISDSILLDLYRGNLKWSDDIVQHFIPVVMSLTNFEWLKLIAKNSKYHQKSIYDFLEYVETLVKVNGEKLSDGIKGAQDGSNS